MDKEQEQPESMEKTLEQITLKLTQIQENGFEGTIDIESPNPAIQSLVSTLNIAMDKARLNDNFLKEELENTKKIVDELNSQLQATDELTGLMTKVAFDFQVELSIQRSYRTKQPLALLLIKVNNLRDIQSNYGFECGNKYLINLSNTLKENSRQQDSLARYRVDVLACVLTDLDAIEDIGFMAERLLNHLTKTIEVENHTIEPEIKIGIASLADFTLQRTQLAKRAELALDNAIESPCTNFKFYSKTVDKTYAKKDSIIKLLKGDFTDNFEMFIQPQYLFQSKGKPRLIGGEFLLRAKNTELPFTITQVIQVAENQSFMHTFGHHCLVTSLKKAFSLHKNFPDFSYSINLSPLQFYDSSLLQNLEKLLETFKLPKSQIIFELTESAMIESQVGLLPQLKSLQEMGYQIAMDDFGKGQSSLTRLKELPINILKLDTDLITSLDSDPAQLLIVKSVIDIAHSLRLSVTAEGVETSKQLELLKSLGCKYGQGFYLAKPMSIAEFIQLANKITL